MYGGGGHIFAMIASLKANRSLLKKRDYFKKIELYLKNQKLKKRTFKTVSESDLEKIKTEIRAKSRKEVKLQIVVGISTFLIGIFFLWKIFKNLGLEFN